MPTKVSSLAILAGAKIAVAPRRASWAVQRHLGVPINFMAEIIKRACPRAAISALGKRFLTGGGIGIKTSR